MLIRPVNTEATGLGRRPNTMKPALSKNQFNPIAKKIMATYACRDLDAGERGKIEAQVQKFFADQAGRLSESEIMDHMATPMKALAWFNTYICESFWNRCCSGVIPDNTDTCALAH